MDWDAGFRVNPRIPIIVFWVVFISIMTVDEHVAAEIIKSTPYRLSTKLILNICITYWLVVDALAKGMYDRENLNLYIVGSVLVTEIALPIYMVHSRGWFGAVKTMPKFTIMALAAAVVMALIDGLIHVLSNTIS